MVPRSCVYSIRLGAYRMTLTASCHDVDRTILASGVGRMAKTRTGGGNPMQLTPAEEQLLRDLKIDAQHPGPILHDFQLVLDYIKSEKVAPAEGSNLLPMSAIPALDSRLARPLRLD